MDEHKEISMQKTSLSEWDEFINYLIEAIDESNFMKRAEDKPMMTTRHSLESHITSRSSHVRAAADIAKRIAQSLGLNYNYIYAAMLMHDAGHPFSAHEGEEIFNGIGEEYNICYYHHNAKGVEVVINENICEKAINKIPGIEHRGTEFIEELREEFYYFLDVIISHDGEAGIKELGAKPKEYPDMKTAVYDKLRLSNATNNYKFVAQTIEGRIAKYADVIAYLSSDVQDRFRLGIQKNFDDDYLEFIGEILTSDFIKTREEKIEVAKKMIEEIKEKKIMQLISDAKAIENQELIKSANEVVKRIHEQMETKKLSLEKQEEYSEAIMKDYIQSYKKNLNYEQMTNEQKKFCDADIEKIGEFTRKKLRMSSAVVEEITSKIRETLINDLLRESSSKGEIGFSTDMKRLFFRAKELNYKYVPEAKWEYQADILPKAIYKLAHMLALDLRKSGVIQNRFYDKAVRKHIKDEEALKYLKTLGYTAHEDYVKYKKNIGIRGISFGGKKFTSEGGRRTKAKARAELSNAVYHYVSNSEEMFAKTYEMCFQAVENEVMSKIKTAVNKLPSKEVQKRKTYIKFFDEKIANQENYLRKNLIKQYGDIKNITEDQLLEFAKSITGKERRKMEGKMALQMAIDYISGMSDRTIFTHAMELGLLDENELNSSSRGRNSDDGKVDEMRKDLEKNNKRNNQNSDEKTRE